MKQDKKENLQKYAAFGVAGILFLVAYSIFFSETKQQKRMGDIADEKVSVFDELRTDEGIKLRPDPLLAEADKTPPADKTASAGLPAASSVSAESLPPPSEKAAADLPEALSSPPPAKAEAEPAPVKKTTEAVADSSTCSDHDWKLGNCDRATPPKTAPAPEVKRPEGLTLAKLVASNEERPSRPQPTSQPASTSQSRPSSVAASNDDMWVNLASGIRQLKGAAPEYAGPIIKNRCRVMALVMDGVRVSDSQGTAETITLNVKGPMPGCQLPDIKGGLILGAEATISPNRKWITAKVTQCSDPNPKRPTRPCKGVVESITGEDGLEGQVYDQSFFGAMLEFGINAMGFVFLKDLAGSASKVENVWSASATIQIADSFQQMLAKGAAKVSEAFSGREIHLVRGAPVIVTFTEDVVL
jgi:hypothetical protein